MEASPTVVPKSAAICGNSESVTRTIAWLAKPATASRMMERVGTFSAGEADTSQGASRNDGRDTGRGQGAAPRAFSREIAGPTHDRQDIPALRGRGAHLRQVGGGGRIPRRPAGAARRQALLHRHPAAQRHGLAAYGACA